jgi:hypothetical protein
MFDAREWLLSLKAAPPTLAAVARAVGTNEFKLKRDFKSVFNEPVYTFLTYRNGSRRPRDSARCARSRCGARRDDHRRHVGRPLVGAVSVGRLRAPAYLDACDRPLDFAFHDDFCAIRNGLLVS